MKPILLLLLFFIISCKSEKVTNYEISFKEPIPVIDSLFMQMPGMVYYVNDHLIIEDALASESFYRVYDSLGTFIKTFAPLGNSAVEFSTPNLTLLANNDIIVSDLNRGNAVIYKNGVDSLCQYEDLGVEFLKQHPLINIHDNVFVAINKDFKSENDELFSVYDRDSLVQSFGLFPIAEKINNKYDVYQGSLNFNKKNGRLVYFSSQIPYYAIYKMNGGDFELIKGDTYAKFDYSINEGNLKVKPADGVSLTHEVALLKDYIVTLGNTEEDLKELPAPNGRGRDFSQLPRSLFVHDYDYNLIKVLSLKTPTIRLTSNINSNLLYLVTYIDGEFNLSKVDIE